MSAHIATAMYKCALPLFQIPEGQKFSRRGCRPGWGLRGASPRYVEVLEHGRAGCLHR